MSDKLISDSIHSVKTHEETPHVKLKHNGETYNLKQASAINVRSKEIAINLTPDNGIQSSMANTQKVNFTLPQTSDLHILDGPIVARFDVSNASGTDDVLAKPAPFLINYVNIYINDQQVERLRGLSIYELLIAQPKEIAQRYTTSATNMSTSYGGGDLGTSASSKWYVPIWCSLSTCDFPVGLYGSNVRVRVELELAGGASQILYSDGDNSQLPTLDRCYLNLTGRQLASPDFYDYKKRLMSEPHQFRTLIHEYNTISAGSVASGSDYTDTINWSPNNLCFAMFAFMDTQDAGSPTALDYEPKANDFNVLSSDGTSHLGMYPVEDKYARYVLGSRYWPQSDAFTSASKFYYTFSPSHSPGESLKSGANNGMVKVNVNDKIQFTSAATTTYEIEVDSWYYAVIHMSQKGNRVRIEK